MKFTEDNCGFINFPIQSAEICRSETGKTLVYIISFNVDNVDDMSNLNLFRPGVFISDDVWNRPTNDPELGDVKSIISYNKQHEFYDSVYFPNSGKLEDWKKNMSFDIISAVCIGWSNYTYEYNRRIGFWRATFNDLTNEGKKLYYSLRKLHNTKELRILTFNNI